MRPGEIEYEYETAQGLRLQVPDTTPIPPEYYVREYPAKIARLRKRPQTTFQKLVIREMEQKLAEAQRELAEKESVCA
jgi:hypothetical protein